MSSFEKLIFDMKHYSNKSRAKKRILICLTQFKDKSKSTNEKLSNRTRPSMTWETNYEKRFEEKRLVRLKSESLSDLYWLNKKRSKFWYNQEINTCKSSKSQEIK